MATKDEKPATEASKSTDWQKLSLEELAEKAINPPPPPPKKPRPKKLTAGRLIKSTSPIPIPGIAGGRRHRSKLSRKQAKLRDDYSRRRERAIIAYKRGETQSAKDMLVELCALADKSGFDTADVTTACCALSYLEADPDLATDWLKRALLAAQKIKKSDWKRDRAFIAIASQLERLEHWKLYERILNEVLIADKIGSMTGLKIRSAVIDKEKGKDEKVLTELKALAKSWPKDTQEQLSLILELGEILVEQKSFEEAESVLARIFDIHAKAYSDQPFIIKRWVKNKDLSLRSREKIQTSLTLLATSYLAQNKNAKADEIKAIQEILRQSPADLHKLRQSRYGTAFGAAIGDCLPNDWIKDDISPDSFYNPRDYFLPPNLARSPFSIGGISVGMKRDKVENLASPQQLKKQRIRVSWKPDQTVGMVHGQSLSTASGAVRKGSSTERIQEILGKPNFREPTGWYWEYKDRNGYYRVMLRSGKARSFTGSTTSYGPVYLYLE